MSNLISNDEKFYLTGALNDHFDTFSRPIIIHKQPLTTYSSASLPPFPGYNNLNNQEQELVYRSGVYPAIRIFKNNQELTSLDEIKSLIANNGLLKIKVKPDAMEYIKNGPNERVEIDGLSFNINSEAYSQNYLGLIFYYYTLKATS